ncbi:MAG TPA: STAS/SEC14 domain-containing protein [Salinimicrobium sp.]|nr:STAS/SEC14 domain-containing protein [Salinimicrobium sp.]
MLHKIDLTADHVAGFRWEGKFDEKGVKQSLVQFLPELQMRSKLNLYLEVANLSEIEAKALYEAIKFDIMNMRELMTKIDKVALVTDVDWLKNMTNTASIMVPKMEIKVFKLREAEAAKIWVE